MLPHGKKRLLQKDIVEEVCILGNGTGINDFESEIISKCNNRKIAIFGTNRIFLHNEIKKFIDLFIALDRNLWYYKYNEILKLEARMFCPKTYVERYNVNAQEISYSQEPYSFANCYKSVSHGYNSVYAAIQISVLFFPNVKKISLFGVDFDFNISGKSHFYTDNNPNRGKNSWKRGKKSIEISKSFLCEKNISLTIYSNLYKSENDIEVITKC